MAYEDVQLTAAVTKPKLTLTPATPQLTMNILVRRTSSVTVNQGAALTLRVVNEAI